jgi:hypothetical protein
MNKKIKYNDVGFKDVVVDKYLTKAQQTLPKDLQKKIIKAKKDGK